ncbi:epidermal growth factor receptor kinase substrate 8 [Episyrphus balteatus]|uniref:epidermal growth factor receptor kinase substrate 8 n=1 Tax=Episyrphus balteatus TaxID=286459 RepID=UPI0024867B93|nr:epidermal growth factor receptor kinase substrate 8 [Episyrphus balteatus]
MGRTSLNGSSAADNLSALFQGLNHHNHQGQSQQHNQSNGIDHDKPTYAMDHLATFKVKHESELRNPIEKMKLLKDTNICPQKMFMRFNGQWIVILDQDKVEIESFPGSLIHEPVALVSKDPLEEFNNLLIFSVSGSALGNTEMHVFQVEEASAVHLVEDLKLVRSGKTITQTRDRIENKPKQMGNGVKDQYGIREAMMKSRDVEDTKERDINVLNHCFEDIEKFVFRLHYAAEALDELQNRKLENKLNTNPHGEGLLVLRSRPPVENEFMDILAKFKLAFNFLTRLQAHIGKNKFSLTDIFVSLESIVVICNDVYVNAGIPQAVVNPLLRRETISYLESQVTPKQREFWRSLGRNWNSPKDSFKDHTGSYHPIFFDDWSPDFSVDDPVEYIPPPIIRTESNLMHDITNATWHRKLKSRNVRIAEVTHPREADTDKELTVAKGEYLEVIDDSKNWWKTRNHRGLVGYVPNTILNPHNFDTSETSTYIGQKSDTESLASSTNDRISVKESGKAGRTSLFAYEIEREMPKQVLPRRSFSEPLGMLPPPPPPPPPAGGDTPPITPVNSFQKELALAGALVAMRARNDCETDNLESQEEIQEELRQSMLLREKRRDLEILKTPQIYIEEASTSKEVEEWLRGKGFSNEVIKKLHGLSGKELFALPDATVESYFCKDDSKRLKSQLLLQKKISGFKTTRSNELQAILARRRQKADATIMEVADEV